LSLRSVLRPGIAFTCWAFTSNSWNCPSKMSHTGFQYTPVDSIATWVTPHSRSQSAIANKSRVNVLNLRFCSCPCWPSLAHNTHAVTLSLCTSSPQQQRYTISIVGLLCREPGTQKNQRFL